MSQTVASKKPNRCHWLPYKEMAAATSFISKEERKPPVFGPLYRLQGALHSSLEPTTVVTALLLYVYSNVHRFLSSLL
jgi:hypothetical protein